MAPIRGQVAKVLTARELLINRGLDDGVRVGMRFSVLDPQTENVKDPETGRVLGSIARPKVVVEVTQVEPHLSLAATFRKTRVNIGGTGSLGLGGAVALAKMFDPPNFVDRYETFKSSEQTWEAIPEAQSFVKVGDPVVQFIATPEQTELAGAQISTEPERKPAHPSSPARRRAARKPGLGPSDAAPNGS
jgi:hypothetical protein